MTDSATDMREFHWLMDMLATIEVGLVLLDEEHRIQVWNAFMEHHSGRSASSLHGQSLFNAFPELPREWLERKTAMVRQLNTRAFSCWEQRPYLFPFPNGRPITGTEPWMYQNITFCPLTGSDGQVSHVCLLVYDVSDAATNRRQLEQANAQLSHLSRTDQLTGLLNRGTWEALLAHEYERHSRYQGKGSLVMFDIDHFKQVNDNYGHQAGDEILRELSRRVLDLLRQSDIAGRYGGEEFALILPETDAGGAAVFAERLRQAVADTPFTVAKQQLSCSISLGTCPWSEDLPDYACWLARADQALYASKHQGRNRCTPWSSLLDQSRD
ncbi:MAG: sensor domain-containing diguanylate cyclase [Halomonadaceae bacterium]|nr:MAG: sensor domain-containing diguanylate cyclase [Halomonadaceae bacterium]